MDQDDLHPVDKTGEWSVDEGHAPRGDYRPPCRPLVMGLALTMPVNVGAIFVFQRYQLLLRDQDQTCQKLNPIGSQTLTPSSDDENWSELSSGDSDAESHRRRRDKVKTGLVSDDGYQRFDPPSEREGGFLAFAG